MTAILHIIPAGVWARHQGEAWYRGDTLDAEGFIHFSTPEQVVMVADARFRGHPGLLLLVIDPARLAHELRYELPFEVQANDSPATIDMHFPHLYGPLNLDAVVQVLPFEPQADGTFSLPAGL